jgi:hypothetical protein
MSFATPALMPLWAWEMTSLTPRTPRRLSLRVSAFIPTAGIAKRLHRSPFALLKR